MTRPRSIMPPSAVDWSEFSTWQFSGSINVAKLNSNRDLEISGCHKCRANRKGGEKTALIPLSAKARHLFHGLETSSTGMSTLHHAYAQFAAGAIGGGTATYTTHWLDTIKVKMQTFPTDYRSGAACLRHTLQQEGVRGLYHGAAPAVLSQATKAAVVFCSYGACEELVRGMAGKQSTEQLMVYEHATAGAMTGVVASFFLCPMELVKCRLQALHHLAATNKDITVRPPLALAREVLRTEGIRGLYRGLNGIWIKEIPGSFLYFGSYETAKSAMATLNPKHKHSNVELFSCGVFAGLCYCVTHPVESVKTRVQVMSAINEPQGFLSALSHILRNEGFKPLCSGFRPTMLRACVYSGIQFMMYEKTKAFIIEAEKSESDSDT